MVEKFSVSIDLKMEYDTDSKKFKVLSQVANIIPEDIPAIVTMTRELQRAEIQYGILTLGSKSSIGKVLKLDDDITVIYDGTKYGAHIHKSSYGRIDRLSGLIKRFSVGTVLELEYNTKLKELYIKSSNN